MQRLLQVLACSSCLMLYTVAAVASFCHSTTSHVAGVQGIHMPPQQLLQSQYIAHLSSAGHLTAGLPASNCKSTAAAAAVGPGTPTDVAALLQDSCNWLPAQQQEGEQQPGAVELPLPTRALLEALQQHLQETLAHPGKVRGLRKARQCLFKAAA
jgi:hypothetical protein